MKLRSILTTMLVVVGLALTAVTARGADLTINSWFDVPSLYGGQANITLDGTQRTVNAGQLRATVGGTGEQWVSYCTDLGANARLWALCPDVPVGGPRASGMADT